MTMATLQARQPALLIFDQDGTLYPNQSRLAQALRNQTKQWLAERLGLARESLDALYPRLGRRFPHIFDGLEALGLSIEEYHRAVFDAVDVEALIEPDHTLVALLRRLPQPKYIVTLAPRRYSERLQRRLGLEGLIRATYCVAEQPVSSKAYCYRAIAQHERLEAAAVYVVGDNLDVDVLPAIALGCQALHISSQQHAGRHHTLPSIDLLDHYFDTFANSMRTIL
jgi:FMN phosphatase YigB (HAD superfamily)